jgi:hypothetical protein
VPNGARSRPSTRAFRRESEALETGWTRLPAPLLRLHAAVALIVVMLALPATAHAAAAPGVFAGTRGVKVPKGGHATVRAVEARRCRSAVVVQDGGDGFFNSGTITVRPIGITAPG